MYKHFERRDWLKHFGIKEDEIPDVLLAYGILDVNQGKKEFAEYTNIRLQEWLMHNIFQFDVNDKKFVITIIYGSSMASDMVYLFSILGVKVAIQIGCFGGLKKGIKVGDIFLPTKAVRADGVSDYLSKNTVISASPEIVDWLKDKKEFRLSHLKCHTGSIITTTSIFAETRGHIKRWNAGGYVGVDMETAATFEVAQSFNIKRAAILYLADNMIEGRSFLDVSKNEEQRKQIARKVMFDMALKTAIKFS